MLTEKLTRVVRDDLARLTRTAPDDWFFTTRARYGMTSVLTSLAAVRGSGEVITQPFTCATALNPILSAGHIPVYIDTSLDDLSLDTSKLQASTAARALIMQHTFSLPSNLKIARTFANKHHLLLLEDSAHCVGFIARDKNDRPLADISVHSFGVEKMLSTKFGGAVWVNPEMKDHELRDTIRASLANLPLLDRKSRGRARRYRLFNRILNHAPQAVGPSLRKLFISSGLFEPAIMPIELQGKNYAQPSRPDNRILREMHEALTTYEPLLGKRRAATEVYLGNPPQNLILPKNIPKEGYAPARFPLLCENNLEAKRLFNALRDNGHYSGKWYSPTIFPGTPNPELYNYDPELYPIAENAAARILNLPTNITTDEAKEILNVLHRETD